MWLCGLMVVHVYDVNPSVLSKCPYGLVIDTSPTSNHSDFLLPLGSWLVVPTTRKACFGQKTNGQPNVSYTIHTARVPNLELKIHWSWQRKWIKKHWRWEIYPFVRIVWINSYPNLHFCQNSILICFTSPFLAHPNLHRPLLHPDPNHLSRQVHGHQTNIAAYIIKPCHQPKTWTPLAISLDYYTAWCWDVFMFGV